MYGSLPVVGALQRTGSLANFGTLIIGGSLTLNGALMNAGSRVYSIGQLGGAIQWTCPPCSMMYGFGGGCPYLTSYATYCQ